MLFRKGPPGSVRGELKGNPLAPSALLWSSGACSPLTRIRQRSPGQLGRGTGIQGKVHVCAGQGEGVQGEGLWVCWVEAWGCGRRGSKAWGLVPVQLPDQSQEEAGAEFGLRCLFSCR